jgi:carbon monoxide dehydrogenase subunit G
MGNLNITSKVVTVNKSAEQLFDQLSDFKNFESIMPDSVERFEADENSFLFQLRNLPEVRLVAQEMQRPDFIKLKSASSKLDFSLSCQIEPLDDHSCKAGFVFDGEFNMMMRMMIEKPLGTFIESLADKVASL